MASAETLENRLRIAVNRASVAQTTDFRKLWLGAADRIAQQLPGVGFSGTPAERINILDELLTNASVPATPEEIENWGL